MAARTTKPATYRELEQLPANVVGEILGGVLHANPRPAIPHARASTTLNEELGPPFNRGRGGPGGWVLLYEPELHLGEDILVPDHAGWRRERMPEVPDTAFIALAPDWICEILSRSTEAVDRGEKVPIYAREGVSHIWLIDPVVKTLEVLRLDATATDSSAHGTTMRRFVPSRSTRSSSTSRLCGRGRASLRARIASRRSRARLAVT